MNTNRRKTTAYKINTRPIVPLVSLLFIILTFPVWAADAGPNSPARKPAPAAAQDDLGDTVQLPAFTTSAVKPDRYLASDSFSASRIRGELMELAGSISVLTPEFLQDHGPVRIYEATRYVAGVSEGRSSNFQDRQVLRGFENNNITLDNFPGIQQLNTDDFFVDRIEVVKGPSAIIAPTGTPGGSINVVTKVPLYETSRSITAIVGLSNAQRLNVDLTGPFAQGSPWAYRLLAAYQDGHMNREGGNDKRKIIAGQLSYRASTNTMMVVRGSYDYRRLYDPITVAVSSASVNGGEATLAPGFKWTGSRNSNESWAHRSGPYMVGDFRLTTSIGSHISMRLAAKAQYNIQDDESLVLAVPSLSNRYNPYTGVQTPDSTWALNSASGAYVSTNSAYFDITALKRTPNGPKQWTQDYGLQYDAAANYRFGDVSSTTVAGVAWDNRITYRVVKVGPNLPDFNLLAPVYGAPGIFNAKGQWTTSKAGTWQYYVNERIGFWKDRVLLTAGAVRVNAGRYSTDLISKVFTQQVDSKNLVSYGVLVRPIQALSVYASRSVNAIPAIANNKALWQEGQQYEFGAKVSLFNNRLSFSAAHFQIAQTNVVVPNPAFVTDKTAPNSLISDIKNHGYEVEVAGGITKNLSMVASLTSLRERDSLGRPIRAIAGQNSALFLNYSFTEGVLRGLAPFAGVTFVGRRAGEAPSPNFTALGMPTQVSYFLPPLTLVSAGARYSWNKNITSILNVDNLTNEKYLISTARANVNTNNPLNLRLTTTYKF